MLGLFIAAFSMLIGYLSLDISNRSLEISKMTSERDSVTSIQMNNNRKNDSILTRYNNLRDSIQQQKTVELLEKYNELADKLLKTQIDADKPSIAVVPVLFTDTIYKKLIPFDGQFYKMSINTFDYQNNGKRVAFNLKAKYQLFYPISNQKYTAGDSNTLSQVLFGTKATYLFHPIIPLTDEQYYFAKITLSWEDHLLGIRKDSTNMYLVRLRKLLFL